MNEENNFCVSCGARLPEGSVFCPECGTPLNGDAPPRASAARNLAGPAKGGNGAIPILILVYGILGLIIGVSSLFQAFAIDGAAYQSMIDQINQAFIDSGMTPVDILPAWTDSTKTLMIVAAVFGTLSPLAALGSYFFCYKTGPKKTAVLLCVAATVLILGPCVFSTYTCMAVPSFIVGALISYLLYNSTDIFTE